MYARPTIDGRISTLGVSGKLWRDALIMYDRASRSLWSQILGEAVAGPATGQKLRELPSQLTTWGDWVERHPDTLVLKRAKLSSSPYEQYHYDRKAIGVRGTKNPDKRLGGKVLVFGMERGGRSAAVPLPFLWDNPVLNARAFEEPILLVTQPKQTSALAYERTAGGRVLTFEAVSGAGAFTVRDRETGSTWDAETGFAVAGEMAGTRLAKVEGTTVYWGIWAQYHEDTAIIDAAD